jgi:hypothetical protein
MAAHQADLSKVFYVANKEKSHKIRHLWDQFQTQFAEFNQSVTRSRDAQRIEPLERLSVVYRLCVQTRKGFPQRLENLWRHATLGHGIRWINEYIEAFNRCVNTLPIPEACKPAWQLICVLWKLAYEEIYKQRCNMDIHVPDEEVDTARRPWLLTEHRNRDMSQEAEIPKLYCEQQHRHNALGSLHVESSNGFFTANSMSDSPRSAVSVSSQGRFPRKPLSLHGTGRSSFTASRASHTHSSVSEGRPRNGGRWF